LAGVFGAAQFVLQHAGANPLVVDVPSWLWQINLLLAGFNLIPAAPLDGGRILRAALWRATHDRARASVLAARAGLGFGGALIAVGAVELVLGSPLGLWPGFMGWFLFSAARAEQAAADLRRRVEGLTVADVMVPHPPTVPSGLTVGELFAGQWPWWTAGEAAVVVAPTGWMEGVVTVDRLQAVSVESRAVTRVVDVAVPITEVPVARPDEPVTDVVNRIYASRGVPAVVLDPANRLAGVVTLGDVERAAAFSPVRSRAA
jgi:CBS domain-containing protein